jgi:DNA invertase Pin-like site-specific DNA recombinase
MYFPSKGVRFLALNDNFDTENESDSDIAPFKHVLNDLYLRDISRKIKSVRKAKAKIGHYTGPIAPLGYAKDPQNKNHLVIDEQTAPIVRRYILEA